MQYGPEIDVELKLLIEVYSLQTFLIFSGLEGKWNCCPWKYRCMRCNGSDDSA
jgi:hypothetical protein